MSNKIGIDMKVTNGSNVKVHYTGRLEDGTVFDSSEGRDPLAFTVGAGQMIPGFDKGVLDLEVGEKKTVTLPPEEAYGQPQENMILTIETTKVFPPEIDPKVGEQYNLQRKDGGALPVTVTKVEGETVTLDANHHLAGKTLIFDIEVVEIA